jgi:hypothetical protein
LHILVYLKNIYKSAKMDDKTFLNELVNAFPEIREDVYDKDWMGLISLQVGCFKRYTQKAIDTNNIPVALKCFQFVEEIINKVEFDIENALVISWISHLSFTKNENLYSQFPPDLKEIFIKLQQHYNSVSKDEKLNTFLSSIRGSTD